MIYAAPFKTKKLDSAITKVFGKAKYFGIYNDETNEIEVIENQNPGGPAIFAQLVEKGVDVVLTPHAGPGAVNGAMQTGIKLYYCGDERKLLLEAVKEFQEGKYIEITPNNYHQFHGHS
jgi:predicted Fe-Mo cluster-binding NifX family protein